MDLNLKGRKAIQKQYYNISNINNQIEGSIMVLPIGTNSYV
jgi:hypothetical protein